MFMNICKNTHIFISKNVYMHKKNACSIAGVLIYASIKMHI